jgi:ferredoxin-NADP reductase
MIPPFVPGKLVRIGSFSSTLLQRLKAGEELTFSRPARYVSWQTWQSIDSVGFLGGSGAAAFVIKCILQSSVLLPQGS